MSGLLAFSLAACAGASASGPRGGSGATVVPFSASPAVPDSGTADKPGGNQTSARAAPEVAPAASSAPPPGWSLAFDAAFSGSQLDSQIWATCYPWAPSTTGCSNFGNTKDPEQEWYQASQDEVSDGALHLVAQREPTAGFNQQGASTKYACRSGMVTSYPSFRFEYGYIQVTAKIPFGRGLWPALWLAAANQNWPPEIDLLEHWANEAYSKVYLHATSGSQGGSVNLPGLADGWHTFGLDWTRKRIVWYYDGVQIFATSTGIPQQDMYLIADLAVDDASPGGCTGSLDIKSVKIWQPPA